MSREKLHKPMTPEELVQAKKFLSGSTGSLHTAYSKKQALRLMATVEELRHAIWHALDDSELHADGERTIGANDAAELERLVPEEEHP